MDSIRACHHRDAHPLLLCFFHHAFFCCADQGRLLWTDMISSAGLIRLLVLDHSTTTEGYGYDYNQN